MGGQARLKTIMENKKELFDNVNGDPTPGIDCALESTNELRGGYLLRLKDWFETAYSEYDAKKTAYESAETNYTSLDCSVAESQYTAQKATCDPMLASIESNACLYAQGFAAKCGSYDDCYEGK